MYKRKTVDEWQIWALVPDYSKKGASWEEVDCSETFREAKQTKKDYLNNQSSNFLDIKIKKARVKNEN